MTEQQQFERRVFVGLLVAVTLLFAWVLKPFFGVIFWSVALALLFFPLRQRLMRRWPARPNRVALATLGVCLVVMIVPATMVVAALAAEGLALYGRIQAGEWNPVGAIDQMRQSMPWIEASLARMDLSFEAVRARLGEVALTGSKLIAREALGVGQNAFAWTVNLVLTLYVTFFLLRDGERLVAALIRAIPLGDAREKLLFSKFAEVTRATIKGSLLVALAQGGLGGLIFAVLGIEGAILWGSVMVVVSLIPAVGAALVWGPVAIFLAATGEWAQAGILTAFGFGVIGMVDNLLRPILVGRDTQLPDYLVLLSTLGGLGLFGMNGLIVGPLVAALFLAFWDIFTREFNTRDTPDPGT